MQHAQQFSPIETNYCALVFDSPALDVEVYGQGMAFPLQAVVPDVHTAVAFPPSAPQQFIASFQPQVTISSPLPAKDIKCVLFLTPCRQADRQAGYTGDKGVWSAPS